MDSGTGAARASSRDGADRLELGGAAATPRNAGEALAKVQPREGVQEVDGGRPEQRLCSCWPWTSTSASPSLGASVVFASFRNTARAPRHELAPHDELAVLERDAVVLKKRVPRGSSGERRTRFDGGGLGAGPDRLGRLRPLAEESVKASTRSTSRPRLAGEHVQARPERDGQRLDDGEVTDPELSEHLRRLQRGQRSPHFSFVRSTSSRISAGPG
jgi:hypothetical protein